MSVRDDDSLIRELHRIALIGRLAHQPDRPDLWPAPDHVRAWQRRRDAVAAVLATAGVVLDSGVIDDIIAAAETGV